LKVIAKVKVLNKRVKHQGQGHKVKNVGTHEKILSHARNTHVKYQHPSTYHLKVIAKVKVFNKMVKHKGQGHKVKNVGTHEKIMSQGTLT
jgi:hypothetical protein